MKTFKQILLKNLMKKLNKAMGVVKSILKFFVFVLYIIATLSGLIIPALMVYCGIYMLSVLGALLAVAGLVVFMVINAFIDTYNETKS